MAGKVAYAAAMSSGETARAPRPMDATGLSGERRTPRRCAICQTYRGPTSSVSCAYTVLSEESVPRVIEIDPL
jgi:hypothetical protein